MSDHLSIQLLGPLLVRRGDLPVPDSAWRSRQERRLLAILAVARGRTVSADRLIEWLWPGADPATAAVSLRSTVSSLRRILEPDAPARASSRYVLTRSGGYAWNGDGGAQIDHGEFLALTDQLADAGRRPADGTTQLIADLERAVALYRGDLLEDDPDATWALGERERVRGRFLQALQTLVELRLDRHEYAAAAELARRGLERAPLAEPLARALMRAQTLAGDVAGALQSYERYRQALDHELGAVPSAPTQALHTAILRGELPSAARPAGGAPADSRPASTPVTSESARPPFVGRARELAALRGWLADLDRRSGGIVTIVGEAGIGKTRLAAEVLRIAAEGGALTVALRCAPIDRGLPFAPVGEALRSLLRVAPVERLRALPQAALAQVADLLPVLRERLTDLPELPAVPPDERRNRQIDGLVDLALALARTLPLVMVCDDAQWADEATLAAIGRLARYVPRHALLIILAYRSDELVENPALHALLRTLGREMLARPLVLDRLDPAAVAELLAGMARVGPERVARLAPRLAASTGGNPLVLTVALQSLLEASGAPSLAALLPELDDGAPLPDPASAPQIRDLVLGRLDRLPEPARALAEQIAVVDRDVSLDLIEQLGGFEALEAAQMLLDRQILVDGADSRLGFAHDLVRSIIVATLSSPRRRLLHRHAAQALAALHGERPERAAELAFHLTQAGRGLEADLLRYAAIAGDHARHAFGYRAALAHYDAALDAGERLGSQAPLELLRRAFLGRLSTSEALLDWDGVAATAERYARYAALRADAPPTLVAPRRLVLLRALTGDLAGAAAMSAAPRSRADAPREPIAAIEDMLRRTALVLQPIDLADEQLPEAPGWQLPAFAVAAGVPGAPADELPELLGRDDAAPALFQVGWAALMQGLLADAEPCLGRAYELALATGQAMAGVAAALQLAHLHALAGQPGRASEWLNTSLETAGRAPEAAWASIWPQLHQGFLWLLDDELSRAEARFVEMADRLAHLPAFQSHRAAVEVGLGLAALSRGDLAAAAERLSGALASPQLLYGFVYVAARLGAARLAALRGDLGAARQTLAHALAYSVRRALLPEYARSAIEVARIERDFGNPADALPLLRQAADLTREGGLAPLSAATGALLNRLEVRARDP